MRGFRSGDRHERNRLATTVGVVSAIAVAFLLLAAIELNVGGRLSGGSVNYASPPTFSLFDSNGTQLVASSSGSPATLASVVGIPGMNASTHIMIDTSGKQIPTALYAKSYYNQKQNAPIGTELFVVVNGVAYKVHMDDYTNMSDYTYIPPLSGSVTLTLLVLIPSSAQAGSYQLLLGIMNVNLNHSGVIYGNGGAVNIDVS